MTRSPDQSAREADEALDHDSPLEELFEEQLACADMVVINKTDLLGAASLERVNGTVRDGVRAGVRVITARDGAQIPLVQKHASKIMPWLASASRCGVRLIFDP